MAQDGNPAEGNPSDVTNERDVIMPPGTPCHQPVKIEDGENDKGPETWEKEGPSGTLMTPELLDSDEGHGGNAECNAG